MVCKEPGAKPSRLARAVKAALAAAVAAGSLSNVAARAGSTMVKNIASSAKDRTAKDCLQEHTIEPSNLRIIHAHAMVLLMLRPQQQGHKAAQRITVEYHAALLLTRPASASCAIMAKEGYLLTSHTDEFKDLVGMFSYFQIDAELPAQDTTQGLARRTFCRQTATKSWN
ncbi:MAG: hypothetical protein FRX49_04290 [Trebouxia sp. A1-2]|nr:MAG: hypothetical protein FRX49_04290 [Trebouxia sp. A1-2]